VATRPSRAGYWILAGGLLVGLLAGLLVFTGLPAQLPWVHAPTATPGGPIATPAPAPVTGAPAPDFTLTDLAGQPVQLSSLKGQVVLINFWATWCIPCRAEMPAIQQAYNARKDQGFTVLAVNLNEPVPDVQSYVTSLNVNFPVLLDAGDSISNLYRVRGYPTSFFIDRGGTVAIENVGMMTATQLADNLAKLGLGE
jgi:cytochrome c biogenesis protein CcmG, thiol:disulfide interchange protein DsbE